MLPALSALIALQHLDSAADTRRKRLNDIPAAEKAIDARLHAATTTLNAAKAALADNQHARRELEKQVAQVDSRLSRFDDHKAAVKTNQEYTALLHEIAMAKAEKDSIEEKILGVMEAADVITNDIKAAEAQLAEAKAIAATEHAALTAERDALQNEMTRLAAERARHLPSLDAVSLSTYEQLLKNRKGVAVTPMIGEICGACHVRLRPHVSQQIRRNDAIVQCDSCRRILFFEVKTPA